VSFQTIVRSAKYNQAWPDHIGENGDRKSPKLSGGDILQGEEQIINNSNFLVSITLKIGTKISRCTNDSFGQHLS